MTLEVGREFGNAESSASVPWAKFCPEPASGAVCWSNAPDPACQNETTGHIIAAETAAILPVILVLLSCVRPEAARLRWVSWQPQDMAPEWCAAHQAARADAILDKVSRFCERTSGTRH